MIGCLIFVKHNEASRDIIAVKEFGRQDNDTLDQVRFDEPLPNRIFRISLMIAAVFFFRLFRLPAEEDALGHDDNRLAGLL